MDVFEAIKTRCSARQFKPDIPPLEDVKKIIDAARLAPSSNNAQMWHYVVIYSPDTRKKIKQAITDFYNEMSSWPEAKDSADKLEHYKHYSTFFTDAPVNIAVLMEYKGSAIEELLRKRGISEEEIKRGRPNPSLLSVGAAIENLSLAAHSMGYGTCWLTAPIYAYKKLEEILEVKQPYQLVSFLCLGKPLEKNSSPKKKELSQVLRIIE